MMRGSPTAQAVFTMLRTFVTCCYAYVLQLHRRLQVELNHGMGRSTWILNLVINYITLQDKALNI